MHVYGTSFFAMKGGLLTLNKSVPDFFWDDVILDEYILIVSW